MLVCGFGNRREAQKNAHHCQGYSEKMLLNGMTHLFTCYLYVGMSVFMLSLKVCVCAFDLKQPKGFAQRRDSSNYVGFELSYH